MARVLTNNTAYSYAIEASLATLPGSPTWFTVEPNTVGRFGAQISSVARDPLSKDRQRRKGATVDLDSAVEMEVDITGSSVIDFIEGFFFATADLPGTKGANATVYEPTNVDGTADEYDVAANGDLVARELVFARGFTNSANNGLKQVASGSTGTTIAVEEVIVDEASPPSNAEVEVCGYRGATGDIEIDANLDLFSTVLDFETLGLNAGQWIKIGGDATLNKFATAANNQFARIESITTNVIFLDKKPSTIFVADNGSAKEIDILYGRFIRNVAVDNAAFLEQSFQFEAAWENLQNPTGTGDEYEYAKGNYCNTLGFNLPLADKATMAVAFVGTDTDPPSTSRATNAATPVAPARTDAYNTVDHIASLRIQEVDETALTTDFKSLTFTLNNNVAPEKVLGTLGAAYMNYGNFEVDLEAEVLFTDSDVIDAIRNHTTVTMDWILQNDDGGMAVDIPSLTLDGGDRQLPRNESVILTAQGMAFNDPTLGYSASVSLFAYLP